MNLYPIRLKDFPWLQRNFHHKVHIFRSFAEQRVLLTKSLIALLEERKINEMDIINTENNILVSDNV